MTGLVEHRLGDLLVSVEPPVPAEDDALASDERHDWAITTVYGQPRPPGTFAEETRRHSIWQERSGAMLLGVADARALPHLLRFLGVADSRDYALRLTTSDNPLGDGYLTCLRFTLTGPEIQTATLAEIAAAFVDAEVAAWASDIEGALERHYESRPAPPQDPVTREVMRYVDFPGFDSGTMYLGFGLLLEDWPRFGGLLRTFRLWSRSVHAHK